MDFTFAEEQLAVAEAARGVFDGRATPERVAEVEATEDRVDHELWRTLAAADLLGLAVPEAHGGAGLGLTELALVLEAQGRRVAPAPLWPTLVLGALPIARFGSPELQARWLPGVVAGDVLLTAALSSVAVSATARPTVQAAACSSAGVNETARPSVHAAERSSVAVSATARRSVHAVGGYRLTGTVPAVPAGHVAARIIVPARTETGETVLVLVDPAADGVRLERAQTTNREVHTHLHLSGVEVGADDVLVGTDSAVAANGWPAPNDPRAQQRPVGDRPGRLGAGDAKSGEAVLAWLLQAAWTGLSALALGVAESALEQTAAYLNEREQFGRPLSTFQGTMLRAADAAIDVEAMRVTLWQAAWRLDTERDATDAVRIAKWQAAERGQRVVHAAQHLHGGIGADVTYPIHRYFLWGKQIELLLGGPSVHLEQLGRSIARQARHAPAGAAQPAPADPGPGEQTLLAGAAQPAAGGPAAATGSTGPSPETSA